MYFELNINTINFVQRMNLYRRYTLKVDTLVSKVRSSTKNCNQLLSTLLLAQNCAIVKFNDELRKNKVKRYEIKSKNENRNIK